MRIALTGGIAEGKSTVLGWIQEAGWPVYSSDSVARELFLDPAINRELAAIAGVSPPIEPHGLREAMLGSPAVRRRVNALLHPLIGKASEKASHGFFEAPLLIEACLQLRYDRIWVATCGIEEQRRRLLERYREESLVKRLLAAQLSTNVKIVFADRIIRTNEPFRHVRSLLEQALQELAIEVGGGP